MCRPLSRFSSTPAWNSMLVSLPLPFLLLLLSQRHTHTSPFIFLDSNQYITNTPILLTFFKVSTCVSQSTTRSMSATGGLLSVGGSRISGQSIRTQNVLACSAIANIVKSSLGPVGLDKMLVDDVGDITVTNDGATILKLLEVQHPAAKILVELAQLQDEEVGDGTTSVVSLFWVLIVVGETNCCSLSFLFPRFSWLLNYFEWLMTSFRKRYTRLPSSRDTGLL